MSAPGREEKVNKRAGHVAVSHRERAVVWGGYLENQTDQDQYWNTSEVSPKSILRFII